MTRARKPGTPGKTTIPKEAVLEARRRLKKAFVQTENSEYQRLEVIAQQHYLYLETVELPIEVFPGLVDARFARYGGACRAPLGRLVWTGDPERWCLQLYKWSDECWDEENEAGTGGGTPEDCLVQSVHGWSSRSGPIEKGKLVKKPGSKRSKADRMAVKNLIASALANFMCARTGVPGFGNVDSAQESLLEVLRIDPQNLEAMNLLAQCCAQTRRHDEAWSYFLKEIDAAKKKDDVVKLTCALAEVYEKRRAYRRAIRLYREALNRHEDPRLHVGLGYCLGKISRFAESVRHHRRAAELAPRDVKVLSDFGYSLTDMDQLEEAESTLLRAVELDPKDELARGNLEHCRKLMAEDGGR